MFFLHKLYSWDVPGAGPGSGELAALMQMHAKANFNVVRVHTSCAGVVNAGFLAVERAMGERHVATRLVVATELVAWRREALAMQYPHALLVTQAAGWRAFTRHAHILVASWP